MKTYGEPTSGNKDVLVAKCYALQSKLKSDQSASASLTTNDSGCYNNPFSVFEEFNELTYDVLNLSAKDRVWSNDLRNMVECNFHQVYDYLVSKTHKYDDKEMKGSCYKKMKSYKLYAEGHVSNIEVAKGFGHVWVKSKVIASMRKTKYRVMIIFSNTGDVRYAACECPAGLGIGGCGKCNHIGGLLFAVQTFFMNGLHTRPEKVSSTSKLNGWVVPRNLTIKPKPIKDIKVSKIQFGSDTSRQRDNQNSLYDPRAPQHRSLNVFSQNVLYQKLSECAPTSGFFLFHEKPDNSGDDHEQIEFTDTVESLNVSENATVETTAQLLNLDLFIAEKIENNAFDIPTIEVNLKISDDIDIDEKFIDEHVLGIIESEVISKETIKNIESNTKLQSQSELWQQLHRSKMTASNFGKIIKCSLNPNSLIKGMLYDNPTSKYLEYGKEHEQDAIDMYINYTSVDKNNNENIKVVKSGLLLSEERPGYGASLDGFIIKSENGDIAGGLECKCPASKCGMSISEACEDSKFYLTKDDSGNFFLKRNHNYYLQVQGQLFISKLEFIDFVVWFGPKENIFVERIYFDHAKWYDEHLPALDFFYKWVFIPEMLTRRVKRGLELHSVAEWKQLKTKFIGSIKK